MRSTGIVRRVDNLGRIVIPMELRRVYDIVINDPLEIFVDGERIILKKYTPACVFCGEADRVTYIKDKLVCHICLDELKEINNR